MRSSYFEETSQFTEKPEEPKRLFGKDTGAGRTRDSQAGSAAQLKNSPTAVMMSTEAKDAN